jgi:hypothetical protein
VQGRYFIPLFPLILLALYGTITINGYQPNHLTGSLLSLAASTIFIGGLILTYHVTCGSTYYTLGMCYQPFYKNFSPLLASSPPVSDGVILMQEIVPACNGITEIQVHINSKGSALNGKTAFVLKNVTANSIVADYLIDNTDMVNNAWLAMDFKPDWKSSGQTYTLTIRGIDSPINDGPLLAYSMKPEYPLGTLFQGTQPLENDIIFRYGCLTGINKLLSTMDQ